MGTVRKGISGKESPLVFKTLIKTVKPKIKNTDLYGIKIKSIDFSIATPYSEMGRRTTAIITHTLTQNPKKI